MMIKIRSTLLPATASLTLLLQACAGMGSWEQEVEPEQTAYNLPPPAAPRESEPLPVRPVGPGDYLVKKGDTVYSIAFRNQVDYRELARWNNIGSDYLIYPGQVLRMGPAGNLPTRSGQVASQVVDLNDTGKPKALSTTPTPVVRSATPAPTAVPVPIAPNTPAAGPVAMSPVPQAAETPVVETPTGSGGQPGWRWPVDGTVVRGFNPDAGARGLDFTGTVGQPVAAAAAGKVVYSGSALKGYGELVIIKHDELHLSAYGYNRRRLVNEGDVVAAGQQIAELGVGPENKPVLHFEIRERGRPVNPVPFLPARH